MSRTLSGEGLLADSLITGQCVCVCVCVCVVYAVVSDSLLPHGL